MVIIVYAHNNLWDVIRMDEKFLRSSEKQYAPIEWLTLAIVWSMEQT